MRLATIVHDRGSRAVVLNADGAVPVDGFADVGALLRAGEPGWQAARAAERSAAAESYEEHDLLRPVLAPDGIFCVGLNYRTHITEMGREIPSDPTLFGKLARALTDPFADVELPAPSLRVDYEGELGVIIGRPGRAITPDRALEHVAGLTVLNDVTARDYQRRSVQWFAGKNFQRSTPVGPWMITLDEVGELSDRQLRLTVNEEERQRAPLGDLVFDIPALIADISTIVELLPGDIIATGTPGGVGDASDTYLAEDDVVEVSIEGVGTLRNTFVTAVPTHAGAVRP